MHYLPGTTIIQFWLDFGLSPHKLFCSSEQNRNISLVLRMHVLCSTTQLLVLKHNCKNNNKRKSIICCLLLNCRVARRHLHYSIWLQVFKILLVRTVSASAASDSKDVRVTSEGYSADQWLQSEQNPGSSAWSGHSEVAISLWYREEPPGSKPLPPLRGCQFQYQQKTQTEKCSGRDRTVITKPQLSAQGPVLLLLWKKNIAFLNPMNWQLDVFRHWVEVERILLVKKVGLFT